MASKKHPRIFCQITSYRDPECQWTIKNLFEKAKYPDRIYLGICDQLDRSEDEKICLELKDPRPSQIRRLEFHPTESKGAGWARAQAQTLWQGEEYTLGIDAHMRFVQDWDEKIIAMLERCPSKKPVLSTVLPGYVPPNELQKEAKDHVSYAHVSQLGPEGDTQLIHLHGGLLRNEDVKGPIPGAFWIGNFIFCRSSLFEEVPHDPHIYFQGEETAFSARIWTHGYDIFQPDEVVLYHQWAERDRYRPRSYRDLQENLKTGSLKRIKHLLRLAPCMDPMLLVEMDKYCLGKTRPLEAYWDYCGIDLIRKKVQEFAAKGKWPNYEEWKATKGKSMAADNKKTIFVQIASYRDPECQWTVKDLFEKATYPDRIHVGICWQYDPEEDADCFQISTRPDQVRVAPFHWKEGKGVCWARHMSQLLYEDEDYVFMTDSHMRFVQGWDEKMITELKLCDSEKPLITCHPAAYTPPDNLAENPLPTILRAHPFDGPVFRSKGDFLNRFPDKPLPGAYLAAGYIFASGKLVREVPYDPYMYFNQEEISLTARMYTHGWDIFYSSAVLTYHYYIQVGDTRKLHWSDHEEWIKFNENAQARIDHLLGYQTTDDPEALQEFESYGLGKARTLQQYEEWAGIDFKHRAVKERGLRCGFITDLPKWKDAPINIPEIDAAPPAPFAPAPAASSVAAPVSNAISMPQPARKADTSPLPPLKAGDFVPFFSLKDQNDNLREIQNYPGIPTAIHYLPIKDTAYIESFFKIIREAHHTTLQELFYHRIYVLAATQAELKALEQKIGTDFLFWADEHRTLANILGIADQAESRAYTLLADAGLKTIKTYRPSDASSHLQVLFEDIRKLRAQPGKPTLITRQAPIILVPNALPRELREELIQYWENGRQYKGTIGLGENAKLSDAKRRTDVDVNDRDLLRRIDEALSKSAFPEIRKVSGFEVKYRERYKIGRYTGEEQGHYTAHRDTGIPELAYRRYSMSIALTGDYEGGALEFSEYPEVQYKLPEGGAALFPSSLMHKVNPVTSGTRFVLIGFLFGEAENAYREEICRTKGTDPGNEEHRLLCDTQFEGIEPSPAYTRSFNIVNAASLSGAAKKVYSYPDPKLRNELPFDQMIMPDLSIRQLEIVKDAPPGILVINDYLEAEICDALARYADSCAYTKLSVVDHHKSTGDKIETATSEGRVTDHVHIDGMAPDVLSMMNDAYCNRLAPFYNVNFEWYERPQILRYSAGGKYNQHADADHWLPDEKKWVRTQDRDYSVLFYLNEDYGGGELEFINQKYRFKPKKGMLAAFPSDHRYLHAALPTTSGIRYVIVSWAAIIGTPRVRKQAPYASVWVRATRGYKG